MNHTSLAAIVAVAIALIGGINHLPTLATAQIMKLPFGSQGLMGSTLSNTQETPLTMHASSSGDNSKGGHPGNGGDNGGGGPSSGRHPGNGGDNGGGGPSSGRHPGNGGNGDNSKGGHPGNGGGNDARNIPVYAITIPFSSEGKSTFEPKEISIPTGMTVIWFNNDNEQHTVTTNSIYSPPETIQSDVIPPNGGSFVHQFNHPGRYLYFDQFNPSAFGIINVGSDIERGKNFDMQIGGINSIPFNPNKLQDVVLSFVPKSIKIPPAISLDYSVTILDSTAKPLYSHTFTDSDGILDVELIPVSEQEQQFTTWGPDLKTSHSDGVFHISGPVLVQDSPYSLQISISAIDGRELQNPISETFDLFALPSGLTK